MILSTLPAPLAADSDLTERIFSWVMENYPGYDNLPEPMVMAACIKWNPGGSPPAFVHQVFATYTGTTSDRPIFLSRLAHDAKRRCDDWAKKKIYCICQMLDQNGKNVLKQPK